MTDTSISLRSHFSINSSWLLLPVPKHKADISISTSTTVLIINNKLTGPLWVLIIWRSFYVLGGKAQRGCAELSQGIEQVWKWTWNGRMEWTLCIPVPAEGPWHDWAHLCPVNPCCPAASTTARVQQLQSTEAPAADLPLWALGSYKQQHSMAVPKAKPELSVLSSIYPNTGK